MKNLKAEINVLKKEVDTLKDSNENHMFINEKLNKALKRSEQRTEQLQSKLKTVSEQSVLLKKQVSIQMQKSSIGTVEIADNNEKGEAIDCPFDGDMSSIMVKAD